MRSMYLSINNMNEFFKKIKLSHFTVAKKEETYKRRGIKPTSNWTVILVFWFVAFCIIAVLSVYFYIQIKNDHLFYVSGTDMTGGEEINIDLLKKITADIKQREEVNKNLDSMGVSSPDPSL